MRSRFPRIAAIVVGAAAALGGACSAVSGLDGLQFDGPPTGAACVTDATCAVSNPCLRGLCGQDGTCVVELATEAPADPTPFDCQALRCEDGAAVTVDDDGDHADDEPCVKHGCSGGAPTTTNLPDGDACDAAGVAGECYDHVCEPPCTSDADCTSTNPCARSSCDHATAHCALEKLDGVPTPGVTPVVGDCSQQQCKHGVDTAVVDGSDVPAAASDCSVGACVDGAPTQENRDAGTLCASSGGSFCSDGACVECALDSECPGDIAKPCRSPTCGPDHTCSLVDAGAGTPLAADHQVPGDCRTVVCDGQGGEMSVPDDDPPTDPNECVIDACSNGVVVSQSKANGAPCGNGLACLGGACSGCTTDADCTTQPNSYCDTAAATCLCAPDTCATLGKLCGAASDGCGNPLNCNDGTTDGGETDVDCGGACAQKCLAGQTCSQDGDCQNGQCDGGVCCVTGCKATGAACVSGPECQSGICQQGVCCGTTCDGVCNFCDGPSPGVCTHAPRGPSALTCDATHGACGAPTCACDAVGNCNAANGELCPAGGLTCSSDNCSGDDLCCAVPCPGICSSCAGGTTCVTVTNAQNKNACDDFHGGCGGKCACTAVGTCKRKAGEACTTGGDCASNVCNVGLCG